MLIVLIKTNDLIYGSFGTQSAVHARHESHPHRRRDAEHRGPAVRQATARPEGDPGARVHLSRVLRARPWELKSSGALRARGPCPCAPPPPLPPPPRLPRRRSPPP